MFLLYVEDPIHILTAENKIRDVTNGQRALILHFLDTVITYLRCLEAAGEKELRVKASRD